ncbi:ADP-forming succinate--CoA ligase subunit beta [Geobacter sulfurreducens]|uniref:Succinate--CoA ligase [ADP-forming] subunit beta n=1 Tax=Geobacter sulfurreducens (strain ATCC 51573 / DSM 12127 / PCA) TaxID=243231 RepID=SUCC_GEOSL|nr:ADP-forming succinate--CoA ligase subunit beta [Geobacter sulfurreducens]Q74EA5.1 RecName: Full=Succinate--CoA ligase [ADP-forming] subunit beta; AltName: Full=Succinyl-CoA synthetase subunit beta; Short=SCS-beta [Geobacter sulfurreducens PCA]AAR34384.1 succinyl-CoA synthetase, beta subunit [Geobacter sulfurreducens PCA]UAC05104.1 ADP-forming succinate--CoA ligase subunit beta [Geobacter sulfurreducens]HBB69880.1 succinyl-CoA ligase subunit beta [Geobacter sulfurreducens]HCD95647.1 ADP-form
MNIHEYQAKEILSAYGIPVPRGRVALTSDQVERAAKEMGGRCVIKAQIYAGGRGKAGGVKLVHHPEQAQDYGKELFGRRLITPQTGPEGLKVRRILVEEAVEIAREFYLSITLDRSTSRYCLIASAEGGVDIEEVVQKSPDKIHVLTIDPYTGLRPFQARRIALALGLSGTLCEDCVELMLNLYKVVLEKDCSLVEINPLVVTRAGWLMAMDAKINFDDNAIFRHREYPDMMDYSQLDTLEINAGKYDLSYIKLSGNIGCMVNGAGLAMATLDVLKEFGGEPANFLDVGGGATREKVAEAFKIILEDADVKGVFVNIFGGIMRCDVIAQGIIEAASEVHCTLPIVVRMDGSKVAEGKQLLVESGLNVQTADSLGEGAERIVGMLG